jgi:hypothetical protein
LGAHWLLNIREIRIKVFSTRLPLWLHGMNWRRWRTETANQRGGSEWEPIKITFKNSAYEPNFTRVPPQAFLAKPTQPLECCWT